VRAAGFGNDRNLVDFIWVSVDPTGKAYGIFASDGPATGGSNDATPDIMVLRQKGGIVPLAQPGAKPRVRGTKTVRGGRLPGTGVGDSTPLLGAMLSASAAALACRLRLRR
jgi:hypothetical protein